jgi:hypothetical protein
MGMHPHIIGHPNIWGCILIYWDTPVYGDASPCARVPQYIRMHSQTMGHPNMWGCILIYWDTPRVPQYMGVRPHIVGHPSIWECIPIYSNTLSIWGCIPTYWDTSIFGDTSPHTGVPQYTGIRGCRVGWAVAECGVGWG